MNFPADLRYSDDHEWIRLQEGSEEALVGISDFAQSELGDIVFIDINTIGQTLEAGHIFGSVEAVKTVSDLYLPVRATILELNPSLEAAPELVNSDPYEKGYLVRVRIEDPAGMAALMDAEAYKAKVGA